MGKKMKLKKEKGKRKLSRDLLISFPHEIINAFSHLPKVFKRFDMDRVLGDRISRGMTWRYLKKMEAYGLIKHKTKKYYHKVYDRISDWIEKEIMPKIRKTEILENSEKTSKNKA
jgi:hypothetical protein